MIRTLSGRRNQWILDKASIIQGLILQVSIISHIALIEKYINNDFVRCNIVLQAILALHTKWEVAVNYFTCFHSSLSNIIGFPLNHKWLMGISTTTK